MLIKGESVWITGAGSGIGREMTREFLRRGASVIAVDRDAKALTDLKAEAKLLRYPLETIMADVGQGPAFEAVLDEAAAKYRQPAVFVNNAGMARMGYFLDAGLETFEEVMRVNLSGVVYGTHFALSHMLQAGRGLVINIASTAGLVPSSFMPSYTTSKHAVVGFTRALQMELRAKKSAVRLCLVTPGFIDTPILNQPEIEFPKWLRWTIAKPAPAAREIVVAALSGQDEVTPDFGGRFIQRLYRWAPALCSRTSTVALQARLKG